MRHVIPCLLCTVYTFPDVSPCRTYSHVTPPPPRHVLRVFMSRYPQHRAGGMAAPCRARHTSVLVAAHVAIRHLTTSDGIRSTADTITAAPDTTTTWRTSSRPDITHGMTSAFQLPTATRPATVAAASGRHAHRRPHTATRTPRPHTATFHAHHGHNVRGPHCRTHGTKKSPHAGVFRWGLLFYSVTSFTISSAVFPSLAFRNFALASDRFTSGMCFSASWSNLASTGVNLFNRSKIAKP